METPQEFCKRKGFTQEPPGTTSYYIMWSMMRMYARYYHEQQVKSVDLADVGNCADSDKVHYESLTECANKILDRVESGEVPRKEIMGLKILMGRD